MKIPVVPISLLSTTEPCSTPFRYNRLVPLQRLSVTWYQIPVVMVDDAIAIVEEFIRLLTLPLLAKVRHGCAWGWVVLKSIKVAHALLVASVCIQNSIVKLPVRNAKSFEVAICIQFWLVPLRASSHDYLEQMRQLPQKRLPDKA